MVDGETPMKIDSVIDKNYKKQDAEEIKISINGNRTTENPFFLKNVSKFTYQNPVGTEQKHHPKNFSTAVKKDEKSKEERMNYHDIIQDIQRKRRFEEISTIIKSTNSVSQSDKPKSRKDRLLNEIHQNNEIPGKFQVDNSKLTQIYPAQNNDDDFLEFSFCSTEDSLKGTKRSKIAETENDSEFTQTINLLEARLEKIRYQQPNIHKHSNE